MKKIVYAVLATISGLVLLFSYRTSHIDAAASPTSLAPSATSSSGGDSSSGSSGPSGSSGSGSNGSEPAASALADGTYSGHRAQSPYGPVQVRITVAGGRITDVQVPQYPSDNPRDRQINERALPILVSETTDAQSADIHMVSGATYTSEGYLESLQSAIDQAHA